MASPQPADKFRRFRARRRELGFKEVRLWVRDPSAPSFRDEIDRQVRVLTGASEEADVMGEIEAGWTDEDELQGRPA